MITAVSDTWPVCREHKPALVATTAAAMMICGLPFCSKGMFYFYFSLLNFNIDCTLVLVQQTKNRVEVAAKTVGVLAWMRLHVYCEIVSELKKGM